MEQVRYELAAQQEEKPKNEKLQRAKNILSTIALLVVSGTVSSVLGYFFYHLDTPGGAIILINMRIRFLPSRHLEWRNAEGETLLEGNLGTNFPLKVHHDVHSKNASFMRVRWTNHADLETDWWKAVEGVQCYQFRWRASTCVHSALQDCYWLEGAHWYGGGVYRDQQWPVDKVNMGMAPYLTGNLSSSQPYGRILNRYWLSSRGVAIYVEPESPLWVSINSSGDSRICLKAAYEGGPYWQPTSHTPVTLNYTMCAGPNMRAVHWYMTQTFFNLSHKPPSEQNLKLVSNPTWFLTPSDSASGEVKASDVVDNVLDLKRRFENFTHSKLVLNIETLSVSKPKKALPPQKYQNDSSAVHALGLITKLHSMGFSHVSLLVSPTDFINIQLRKDYVHQIVFRNSEQYSIPPRIRWETTDDQLKKAIDLWFRMFVERRGKDLNVSSFVFHGGQAMALPFHDVLVKGMRSPDYFTSIFQAQALQHDPAAIFNVASGSHLNLSSFLVMHERDWSWDSPRGLSSIIPEALTLSLAGFPYLMSPRLSWNPTLEDPNRSSSMFSGELEDVYVHWLQIITFFPSISFTVSPAVSLSANVTQIIEDLLALRHTQNERLLDLARNSHRKRVPILRPVWWIAPQDGIAQKIDDQYLVGDHLMVAPMVGRRTWRRDIYLPRGHWLDVLRNANYSGPQWLHDYAVQPSQVAHFILEQES